MQDEVIRLMATLMRKNPELTAVLVEQVPLPGWSVGGRLAPAAAHLNVKVTQGTNTAEEKERFVASAAAILREVMGEALPAAAYVVVDEAAADAWGYDGLRQDHRHRGASFARSA